MKRNIECPGCAEGWRKMIGKHEGEFISVIDGPAKKDMLCDGCGVALQKGAIASAVSLWTAANPYSQWESDYIERPARPHG